MGKPQWETIIHAPKWLKWKKTDNTKRRQECRAPQNSLSGGSVSWWNESDNCLVVSKKQNISKTQWPSNCTPGIHLTEVQTRCPADRHWNAHSNSVANMLEFIQMPLKSKRDKLIVVHSHKTILYAMRVSDPDTGNLTNQNLSKMSQTRKKLPPVWFYLREV